ncbi:ABC transporter ATP-binding protein [Sungkyunkwania multivorans]|uniref:ABC transporter ATP-binding protein n=1 Tax=Sungkyunkwania multivorans TaxID=1173618 RepID=A0ABW3D0A6_9FLAO
MKDTTINTILKVEHLSIGYKTKKGPQVIGEDISFHLKSGALVALVGANGIGKSTLLRTLAKIQRPLSGDIFLKDRSLTKQNSIELAATLSLVLTEQIPSKNLTVFELVALGRQPYTNWVGTLSEKDAKKVREALALVQIDDIMDKKCFELSDGQLQKAMIARAIAQDTDLIILDEPTTHLDIYHKAYILKLLRKIAHETKKTVLFSTHEIEVAIQLCDQMVVMNERETVSGSPDTLIADKSFDQIFPSDLIQFDSQTRSFKVKNNE